jgi:very-short-patch-repair endonuclease
MPRTTSEPQGCLAAILSLFGIRLGKPAESELPYRQRDDFLSLAEFSFYRVLCTVVGNRGVVCPKVNLADIFYVARPNENRVYRNRIDRKHVEFLLCDPTTMKPKLGIELDDSSHGRRERQDRDAFVDRVFAAAGLRLLHIPAHAAYNPTALWSQIAVCLESAGPQSVRVPLASGTGPPLCPKCGVPMVLRTAAKGARAGKQFFGCKNYPRCREIVESG